MSKWTYEDKMGAVMVGFGLLVALLVALHWVNDRAMEDGAWIWSCHTMGDFDCGPDEPLIKIQLGGTD